MRAFVVLCTVLAIGSLERRSEESITPEHHGICFCTSVNAHPSYIARRTVLMMRGEQFVLVTSTGMTRSSVTTSKSNIDIQRDEGISQQSIFHVEGNELWFALAEPGAARPCQLGHEKGELQKLNPPHPHFHFQRFPTVDGLAMLRAALNGEANREQLESPHSIAMYQ